MPPLLSPASAHEIVDLTAGSAPHNDPNRALVCSADGSGAVNVHALEADGGWGHCCTFNWFKSELVALRPAHNVSSQRTIRLSCPMSPTNTAWGWHARQQPCVCVSNGGDSAFPFEYTQCDTSVPGRTNISRFPMAIRRDFPFGAHFTGPITMYHVANSSASEDGWVYHQHH